jgi:eukaryotic-like serine/threonine-protein kinase
MDNGTGHRDELAKSIFLGVLETGPTADRRAYLDRRCGRDAALRAEVETLLRHHEGLGDYLERPAIGPPVTREVTVSPRVEGHGTVIGPYKLLEAIGEGGMGTVFMAEQTRPVKRLVALKLIKAGLDSRQVLARFGAERQALALMDHPNIAKVLDAGATEQGRPYFVMDLVKGVPITQFCDERRLSPRERLELFIPVCQAVQHAHQKGIIHRDLKPSNILVGLYDGTPIPKVIDFGVAKAAGPKLTEATLFTGFGAVIGTPEYMSPEQARLDNLDIDTRSDIYSLGVLLYELLTGTTPLDRKRLGQATLLEVLRVIREDEPPRPSTRLSTTEELPSIAACRNIEPRKLSGLVRGELDWIVMKALDKDRNRRYETAEGLAADLRRYMDGEPVQACPPSAWYRFRKFAGRNTAALATAATLAAGVLVAVGSLASAVSVLAASNAEVKAEQKQTKDALDREKQTNDALARALDREQLATYFQRIALAEREVEARNVGRAEELLEECPAPRRGWEWHYLKRRCRQEPLTYREHPGWVLSVAVSPDGKTVASTGLVLDPGEIRPGEIPLGETRVWDRATGKLLHRLIGPVARLVVFHPNGKVLISAGLDKTLRAWDVATGQEVRPLTVPDGNPNPLCLAISPDGRLLVTAGADNTLRVRDAADFRELRTLRGHTAPVDAAAFGPDGRLVTGDLDGTVRIWDATTGWELHTLRGHAGPVAAAFSRDGRQVASCGLDGTTQVWDARTGRRDRMIRGESALTGWVAFSPDGRRLATGSLDGTVRVWDSRVDHEALTLRGHTDMVMGLAFSPDGDQLVSCSLDGTARVWDATPLGAAPRPGERTLRGHTGPVLGVTFRPGPDPSGRVVLASASLDGPVRLWDAATGEVVGTLHGHAGPVGAVSFSRDGRRVAVSDFSGAIQVWDADSGKEVRTLRGVVTRAALSPDGRRVAFCGEVGMVQVRDVDTGAEVLASFPAHVGPVMYLAFSPDGTRLATSGWDRTAAIWDAETGRRLHTLAGHRHNRTMVEFSADGTRLVTASWDKTAKLWDAATGKEVRTFSGHEDNVNGAALSPDGKWLASASSDSTVRVWDAKTGDAIAVLRGHAGYVLGVAFSSDGKYLASSSGYRGKGEVKVWDATLWGKQPDRK